MNRNLFAFASIVLFVCPVAAEWRQFRGPEGQGVSSAKGLPTTWGAQNNIAWQTPLPGPGGSSPIVVGQRIFLTCYSGFGVQGKAGSPTNLRLHVVCLDRKGDILWTKDVAPKLPEVTSIRENHGYASSTPVSDGERLYVFFGKSGVHAFDLNGKHLWAADVGSKVNSWGSAASPMLHGDLLLVNASVESASLVALDKYKGTEKWRASGINEAWNTPIVVDAGGKKEIVLAIMGRVLGFDPASGNQLWNCRTDIGWYMVPSLVQDKGIVYCVGGRTGGALAVRTGGSGDVTISHRLWTGKKGSNVTSPIYHDGHVYWMNDNEAIAFCADAKTGRIVYEERVEGGRQVYGSALLGDGKLYYLSRTGDTYVIAARPTYELLATNRLGGRAAFNSSPAVAGNQLLIRSDQLLYCIGK